MATDDTGSGLPWIETISSSFEPYSFVDFHHEILPALIAQRGRLVAADLRGVPPLAFAIDDGTTFT